MNARLLTAIAALMATGLSACDRPNTIVNAKLCASFKAPAPAASDPAAQVDDCLKRWAYSLAPARDAADVVADAAVAGCRGALARWNQQGLAQANANEPVEAMSITTGQPTNPLAEHYAFAQSHALLYAVEARAGRCAPPPVTDGRPAGTQG